MDDDSRGSFVPTRVQVRGRPINPNAELRVLVARVVARDVDRDPQTARLRASVRAQIVRERSDVLLDDGLALERYLANEERREKDAKYVAAVEREKPDLLPHQALSEARRRRRADEARELARASKRGSR
jgi:hypothetical protein